MKKRISGSGMQAPRDRGVNCGRLAVLLSTRSFFVDRAEDDLFKLRGEAETRSLPDWEGSGALGGRVDQVCVVVEEKETLPGKKRMRRRCAGEW